MFHHYGTDQIKLTLSDTPCFIINEIKLTLSYHLWFHEKQNLVLSFTKTFSFFFITIKLPYTFLGHFLID